MSRFQVLGGVAVVLGGLLFFGALAFLPYVERGPSFGTPRDPSLLDLHVTHFAVGLMIVALAAIATAAGGLITRRRTVLLLAAGLSFLLAGETFPFALLRYGEFGVGFWVMTAAAVAMSAGGLIAASGRSSVGAR